MATFIVILLIIVVVCVVIASRPSAFRITRSVTVSGPASAVFVQVNDFRRWDRWSPWEKLDPATKKSYEGPGAGAGARYAWAGNSKVGEGRMTITESRPNELIRIRLEFLKPFRATHTTDFTFKQEGDRTIVTQSMYGNNNFLGKAITLVMNQDRMIGTMFEKGLAELKSVAEASATQ